MKTTAMRYLATLGLVGALALTVAISTAAQVHAGAKGLGLLAQYCVPPTDSLDWHRIYCRDRG